MPLLLVTYDFTKAKKNYSDFFNRIDRFSNVRLTESSFAIITDKSPKIICGELEKFISEDDNLYVITLKKPFDVCGPNLTGDWLKKTLTY